MDTIVCQFAGTVPNLNLFLVTMVLFLVTNVKNVTPKISTSGTKFPYIFMPDEEYCLLETIVAIKII